MKNIKWNKHARNFIRSLDTKTKQEIGALLMLIQMGKKLNAPQSKPIKSIHEKAHELRIKDSKGIYRIIYLTNISDSIFIPHAFTKKHRKRQNTILKLHKKESRSL